MIEIKNEVVIHLLVSKAAKTYVNLFSKETAISFFMKLWLIQFLDNIKTSQTDNAMATS